MYSITLILLWSTYIVYVAYRIRKVGCMQSYIINLVFAEGPLSLRWLRIRNYCNRPTGMLAWNFRRITLRCVLTEEEIIDLHTVGGRWVQPDPRYYTRTRTGVPGHLLEEALELALAKEDYEEAARLRDQIN